MRDGGEERTLGAQTCVFVFSRSTDRWADETRAAWLAGQDERLFIPLLLEEVTLPPFALSRRYADFRGEDQDGPYAQLLQALRRDRSGPGKALESYRNHRAERPRELLVRIGRESVAFG